MKKLSWLFFVLCFSLPEIFASRVVLVLSGGGAKGLAHIPVIEEIERQGIKVDYVVGTSMGALVGAMYAAGLSSADMLEILKMEDVLSVFRPVGKKDVPLLNSVGGKRNVSLFFDYDPEYGFMSETGLIDDFRIMSLFNRVVFPYGYVNDFDKLPIKFRAVTYNIGKREREVFCRGSLVEAMRASMGMPLVFPIIYLNGEGYIDGGVADNIPVSVAMDLDADVIITSDVSPYEENIDSSLATFGVEMVSQISGNQYRDLDPRANSTLYVHHNMKGYSAMSFNKMDHILDIGRATVESCRQEFENLAASLRETTTEAVDAVKNADTVDDNGNKSENLVLDSIVVNNDSLTGENVCGDVIAGKLKDFKGRILTKGLLREVEDRLSDVKESIDLDSLYFIIEEHCDGMAEMTVKYRLGKVFRHRISLLENMYASIQKANVDSGKSVGFAVFPGIGIKYDNYFGKNKNLSNTICLNLEDEGNLKLQYNFTIQPLAARPFFIRPYAAVEMGHLFNNERSFIANAFKHIDYCFGAGVDFSMEQEVVNLIARLSFDALLANRRRSDIAGRGVLMVPELNLMVFAGDRIPLLMPEKRLFRFELAVKAGMDISSNGAFAPQFIYSVDACLFGNIPIGSGFMISLGAECGADRSSPELVSSFARTSSFRGFPGRSPDTLLSDYYYGHISFSKRFHSSGFGNPVINLRFAAGQSDGISNTFGDDFVSVYDKKDLLGLPFSNLDTLDIGLELSVGFDTAFFSVLVGAGYKFVDNTWVVFLQL